MSTIVNETWIRDCLVPILVQSGKFGTEALVKSIKISRLSMAEAFMLTICYKIKLTVVSCKKQEAEERTHGIVVKITPELDELTYDLCDFTTLFQNEVTAYETIFPTLGWTDLFPKYYYSEIKPRRATIALSDFTYDGFRMSTSMVNLSLEHILVSVIALGKFHGGFYGLKKMNKTVFNSIKDQFRESRFKHAATSEQWDRRLRIGPQRCTRAMRNVVGGSPVPEEFLIRLEQVLEDPFSYTKKMVQPLEPLAVVCHGDYLRNNIAYKYAANKETPIAAMMFDFQTFRYASPMVDLSTFMANSTGVDIRATHFNEIFNTYYTNVVQTYCEAVKIKRSEVPEYLSYDSLLKEYALYLPFGISIASSFISILHVPVEDGWEQGNADEAAEIDDAYNRGGETVDRELRALVTDAYNIYSKLNIDL